MALTFTSFGIIVWEIAARRTPYDGDVRFDLANRFGSPTLSLLRTTAPTFLPRAVHRADGSRVELIPACARPSRSFFGSSGDLKTAANVPDRLQRLLAPLHGRRSRQDGLRRQWLGDWSLIHTAERALCWGNHQGTALGVAATSIAGPDCRRCGLRLSHALPFLSTPCSCLFHGLFSFFICLF
jgi:hypothetical protein